MAVGMMPNVTLELLLYAAFVAHGIWTDMLETARLCFCT